MRFFTYIFIAILSLQFSSCSETATNQNINGAKNTPTAKVESSNSDANSAAVETYTDASSALVAGSKFLDMDQIDKAISALKQAVALDPNMADAHFKLGVALALTEDEVEVKLAKDAKPGSRSKSAPAVSVPTTPSEKAFDAAAKAYQKSVSQNPKDDAAYFNLGRAYNKLNKDKEAEAAFRRAVSLKPSDTDYNTELGVILIKLARYPDAIGFLKKAVELDENNTYASDQLQKAKAGNQRESYRAAPRLSSSNQ